jgi:hypothetical protein
MAQVMRFHEFPANYSWVNMPDDQGTIETATLMSDIGVAVDMDWACGSSGAYMSDAKNAFSNDFGYQTASYSSFNRDQVIQQIRSNRPVLLSGYRTRTQNGILCFMGWCSYSYSNGHAWVSDGFRKHKVCNFDENGNLYSTSTYYYLYMNWGWNGSENGFYRWNDWSPGTRNYQYKKEMITNIRP